MIDEVHSTEFLRRPSVAGGVLVVLAALVGLVSAPRTETAGATTTYMGGSLIFCPLGISISLAFCRNPFESDRNIL